MSAITAADFPLFTQLFTKLESVAATYITDTSEQVSLAIAPAAQYCGMIVIAIFAILLMRGSIKAPLMDATYKALTLIVIIGLALNVGVYQAYIGDFFRLAPGAMAAAITGTPATPGAVGAGGSYSSGITNFVVEAYNLGDKLWTAGSVITNPGPVFVALLVWLGMSLVSAYAAFLFGLATVATAILLAIGPIFILLAVFESGKKFMEMWLQQLFNFGLITVLTSACLQFFLSTITQTTTAANGQVVVSLASAFYFIIFSAICFLVLMQVKPIASGLAGGMALSTQGAFGAAAFAAGRALGVSVKRYTPNSIAQRRRQTMNNDRTNRAWKNFKASQPTMANRVKNTASAAATAYKNKFQTNRVAKAA